MAHLKNRPADRDASDVDHIRFRGRDGSVGGHEKPLWRCAVAKSDLHERRGGRLLKEEAPPMAPTQADRTRPQAVWKSETETGRAHSFISIVSGSSRSLAMTHCAAKSEPNP